MEPELRSPDPVVVLAHPVVIGSLVGWLINDWVLKARFGNEITGKLSDVFAMIVFPLLLAAIAGRFSKHPLRWGLAINTLFFAAINLLAPADRLVERALSVIVSSTLTMDPTDLAVLPVMTVAAVIWRRSHSTSNLERQTARRRIGRTTFAVGALTCMATGAPEEVMSAPHEGSMILTVEQPVVTMPLEYELNGNQSPHLDMQFTITAYGHGGDDEVPYGTVEWTATPEELSFELTDTAWAPVHVEWRADALGEIDDCIVIWWCDDPEEATMTIDVPPLTPKPEPDHLVELPHTRGELSLVNITLEIEQSTTPAIEIPAHGGAVVTVNGRQLTARHRSRTWPVPVPNSCADPCRVTIPVVYFNHDNGGSLPTRLPVFGSVTNIEVDVPRLIDTRTERVIPVDEIEVDDRSRFIFCLRADFPDTGTEPLVTLAGVGIGFTTPEEPHIESSAIDDNGCVSTSQRWIGPDEVSGHDQIVVTGNVRTTAANKPQNLEIVIIE